MNHSHGLNWPMDDVIVTHDRDYTYISNESTPGTRVAVPREQWEPMLLYLLNVSRLVAGKSEIVDPDEGDS